MLCVTSSRAFDMARDAVGPSRPRGRSPRKECHAMAERTIYLNGDYGPESHAKVSVLDRGFRWGDAVYDAVRTFDGRPFKLHEHVERFFRSLKYARIDPGLDKKQGTEVTLEVVRRNEERRKKDGD